MTVPHFPCTISYLPMLITLLSPPATSTSPSPDQHPLIAWQDAWELRAVLLLWLALLLTVPFNLSALSDSPVPSTVDLPARDKLFAAPTSTLAQRVTLLTLPLLQQQGKEGAYAALVLARLFSRSDTVQGLPGFFHWATSEIAESEREGEGNLIANILEFLAMLPTMILPEHLEELQRFTEDLLLHLRGSKTAASSGLVRKLAVKARGRWWVARLGGANWTAGETPEGLEEELDDLMSGLGDKVGSSYCPMVDRESLMGEGHHRPLLLGKVPRSGLLTPPILAVPPDRPRDNRPLLRNGRRAGS